jgi:cytosine/adenosine deaminase-related metal-dependent hydrolase
VTVRVVSAPWVLTGCSPRPLTPAGIASSLSPQGGERETSPAARTTSSLSPRGAGGEGQGEGGLAIPDGAVALDGDTVVAVGPRAEVEARHGEAERLDALILPALVNAHLHLELSHMAGAVGGGEGLPAWIELFVSARARLREREVSVAMTMGAEDLVRAGVAAVGDVSNTLASLAPLASAGLAGTIFHEVFGVTPRRISDALQAAREMRAHAPAPPPGLRVVESPHAIYSTHHPTLLELLRAGPGSIHLAEDPAERAFAAKGSGPFGHLVARMGGTPGDVVPRGRSAVAVLGAHLAPHHLAVHCVDVDDEDVAVLRRSGATVVLCPRSNLFIGGRPPPLDRLLAAGVPLAVGTDSLASSPSLAPLAELALLRRSFPAVSAARLLPLAWNGAAVGAPHVGALAPGRAPGVLALPLGGDPAADPFETLLALGAEERPFQWLARQRPPETT